MFSERLPFAAAGSITLLVIVLDLVLFSANCHGDSSCGDIHNISFPFRLKSHPNDNCGNKNFELVCENNRTILHYYSGKYYVQAIDYELHTIRVVDVGIERNNCSTRPLHSLASFNRTHTLEDPYPYWDLTNGLAVVVSCENPVKSPNLYIDIPASCDHHNGGGVPVSSSSSDDDLSDSPPMRHSYVLVEDVMMSTMMVSDLADSCMVDLMVMVNWFSGNTSEYHGQQRNNNISFLDVHNELANGFELSWEPMSCKQAERQKLCFDNNPEITFPCFPYYSLNRTIVATVVHQLRYYWEEFFYHQYYWFLLRMVIGPILAARFLCAPCVFVFLIRKFRRRHLSMYDNVEGFLRSQNHLMPISYSYSHIKKITKGFRDKLGEGGYGSVYKGKLRSGHLVAIKVLGKSKANGQEFINEVATIGRIHHINVVRLIGFCAEGSKRALVYDFMPNGSLEKYIFSEEENISLSYKQMYEISLGVARGIEYLHRGCDMQILHFDIKPHNILLDENFSPKVSDFGLAKLYPTDDSIVSLTAARGTMGYMAPELFYKNIGGVSYKADVYSFGMLLMEMAGRRKNLNIFADHASQIYFPYWVYDQFKEGRDLEMGETIEEEERQMVRKMIIVALWCIQMKPTDRPSMNKVVEMLEGDVELLQMPPKPFLTPREMPGEDH